MGKIRIATSALSAYASAALPKLLKPLAKYSIRFGLQFQEIAEQLKKALVDAAVVSLSGEGVNSNISRITLMTGVHRKDVARLINDIEKPVETASLLSRVIGQWRQDPKYQNKLGKPKVLPVQEKDGESFFDLVSSISRELNPATVLSELVRTGAVKKTALGVQLTAPVYVPMGNVKEGLQMLGADADDLFDAVQQNILLAGKFANLHIKTEYDNIPDEALPEIRRWLLKEGTDFQKKVEKFLSGFDKDLNPAMRGSAGANRVAVASFSVTGKSNQSQD